jgi:hypothetical protein
MEMNNPAVCVFCGSSAGTDPAHRAVARALGEGIAKAGFSLVFGGGDLGLMGEVARAAQGGGARVRGIIPAFLHKSEMQGRPEEDLIVTPDMQVRKFKMLAASDAFVVLPGGIGTLDEFFEVLAEAQLGVHAKPIIVVNVDGFYDAVTALLHDMVRQGFVQARALELYTVVADADAALKLLSEKLA